MNETPRFGGAFFVPGGRRHSTASAIGSLTISWSPSTRDARMLMMHNWLRMLAVPSARQAIESPMPP